MKSKSQKYLALLCLILFLIVIVTFTFKLIYIEIAFWNKEFRNNIFLIHSDNEMKFALAKRFINAKNVELYDEIAECYLAIHNDVLIENISAVDFNEHETKIFIKGFKCYETINLKSYDLEKVKNEHNKIISVLEANE